MPSSSSQYGGPEVLAIEERPAPKAKPGHVVIEVKSFGLNHAEIYFRKGVWGDVAEISGIECVGFVKEDPEGRFYPGQKVAALVGGMGRRAVTSALSSSRLKARDALQEIARARWHSQPPSGFAVPCCRPADAWP